MRGPDCVRSQGFLMSAAQQCTARVHRCLCRSDGIFTTLQHSNAQQFLAAVHCCALLFTQVRWYIYYLIAHEHSNFQKLIREKKEYRYIYYLLRVRVYIYIKS